MQTPQPSTSSRPGRSCRQYALWLLGRREWSALELSRRLKLKGYTPEEITDCLEFCQGHGLQSDERFAESRTRMRSRTHGNQRIAQELALKGVSPDTAKEVLQTLAPEDERAIAASRRFEGLELTPAVSAKAWRFLASRGFSSGAIKTALKALEAPR